MKRIIIIAFVLLASVKINAQTFTTYADTANYLISQIENKKSLFIGKSFSVLYDSLKIKPVYVMPNYSNIDLNNKDNWGKTLAFYFNYLYRDFSKTHILIVSFDTCPSYNTLYPLLFPGVNQPVNISAILNLYKPLIIKDIILKDYSEDDPIDPNVMVQQE